MTLRGKSIWQKEKLMLQTFQERKKWENVFLNASVKNGKEKFSLELI